jgi:hypothetical protein
MLRPSDTGTDLVRRHWRTVATLIQVASIDLGCDLPPVHRAPAVAQHLLDCVMQIHSPWHRCLVLRREADPGPIESKVAG